jgi:hypothetical protein
LRRKEEVKGCEPWEIICFVFEGWIEDDDCEPRKSDGDTDLDDDPSNGLS